MKRLGIACVVLVALTIVACGGGSDEQASGSEGYEDGIYFAQQDEYGSSGWKYMVTIEVEDGKIVDVEWNGANSKAGTDKITRSASGEYGMVARGGAQAEWHEQAELAEQYLIDLQDPAAMELDAEGYTDAISGVSIHITELKELAIEALDKGPVGLGPYEDGAYSAEAAEFPESGWKDKVDLTVVSGYIVAAYWNPYDEEGRDKYEVSKAGEYGMVERGGAQAPWWEQADAVEAKLIETQDPTAVSRDEEGNTDAISGVSIHVDSFFELADEALEEAR
jgi:major membrane immunogen (membrane-anchored lipoprotein)